MALVIVFSLIVILPGQSNNLTDNPDIYDVVNAIEDIEGIEVAEGMIIDDGFGGKYTSALFFTYTIDDIHYLFGDIEVYATVEETEVRNSYLEINNKTNDDSNFMIGTLVIRMDNDLTVLQRDNLEQLIIAALGE